MKAITIRDIKAFVTAPHGNNLVVVKVETSEPELYGVGCATFTWRYKAVVTAIEEYLRPFLIGRSVHDIEDLLPPESHGSGMHAPKCRYLFPSLNAEFHPAAVLLSS